MYSCPSKARQRSTPTHGHVIAGKRVLVTATLLLRLRDGNRSPACLQCLIDVPENIIQRFEPDREPHHFRRDTGGALLVVIELTVSRRGRMDDQCLRVAHIGQMRQELHRLDESNARGGASLDAKGEDAPCAARQVTLRKGLV